jgi:ribonuclease R
VLRGENNGQVYRLGDKVRVQVIKVDMERRQIDLGLVDILDRVRESERNRGPRHSKAQPKSERHLKEGRKRKGRPGRRERAIVKAAEARPAGQRDRKRGR